jgi:hypothetical protein
MPSILFRCTGGELVLPDPSALLASRLDGGNLVVLPPRAVWERGELSAEELARWSFLVAAAGSAMLQVLPQLAGGCINYWEAGNWALNDDAEPRGPKRARDHRRMHLHLLGRSPTSRHESWRWGESPRFPAFADRFTWAAGFERLTADECTAIVARAAVLLRERYGLAADELAPWTACSGCGYPLAASASAVAAGCADCARDGEAAGAR